MYYYSFFSKKIVKFCLFCQMVGLRPGRVVRRFEQCYSPANGNQKKLEEALNYCVQNVREKDYESYLSALLMPKPVQPRVFSVLALNAEIAMLRHKIKRGSGVAGINQLSFWKDTLDIFGQNRTGLLPRQPVVIALNEFGDRSDLPLLFNLVRARQETLGDRPFENVQKLEENSRTLYGSLIALQMRAILQRNYSGEVLEKEKKQCQIDEQIQQNPAVDAMANAVGILTLIRATVLLLRDGILLLPKDLTSMHGVTAEMAYRQPNSLMSVVRDLCDISADHLQRARSPTSFASIRPELRPSLLASGLRADYALKLLRSDNLNLLDARLHQHHPFAGWKLWWRHWRRTY